MLASYFCQLRKVYIGPVCCMAVSKYICTCAHRRMCAWTCKQSWYHVRHTLHMLGWIRWWRTHTKRSAFLPRNTLGSCFIFMFHAYASCSCFMLMFMLMFHAHVSCIGSIFIFHVFPCYVIWNGALCFKCDQTNSACLMFIFMFHVDDADYVMHAYTSKQLHSFL